MEIPQILKNELVWLQLVKRNDFDRLYAVAADPNIWEQHPESTRYQKEVFQVFFDGALASNAAYLIFERATGQLIGSTRYYDIAAGQSVAIGYTFLAKAYWGGIFNHSIKKLLLNHAFAYVPRVYFHVGAFNLRSRQAVENIGGQYNGIYKESSVVYKIDKANWPAQASSTAISSKEIS
jgi:RimJ/RimL family protein N-acetyltransferase